MRDWKSTGLVLLALLGGYIVTRAAVAMFFDTAASAAIADPERDEPTAPVQQARAAAPKAAPRQASAPASAPASKGWSADASWTQAQASASNTSRKAGP